MVFRKIDSNEWVAQDTSFTIIRTDVGYAIHSADNELEFQPNLDKAINRVLELYTQNTQDNEVRHTEKLPWT